MMDDQELEVKFYVNDLAAIQQRLAALGAHLKAGRVLETNLRFDHPDGRLQHAHQTLRLRQDRIARLTFKGPAQTHGQASLRQEIEFAVSDFDAARVFLEALGYQVWFVYEKYRTTYTLAGTEIVLDELPYGSFVEIEGPNLAALQQVSRQLGLDSAAAIPYSYTVLFDQLRVHRDLAFRDLTFANFQGQPISAESLAVKAADD